MSCPAATGVLKWSPSHLIHGSQKYVYYILSLYIRESKNYYNRMRFVSSISVLFRLESFQVLTHLLEGRRWFHFKVHGFPGDGMGESQHTGVQHQVF